MSTGGPRKRPRSRHWTTSPLDPSIRPRRLLDDHSGRIDARDQRQIRTRAGPVLVGDGSSRIRRASTTGLTGGCSGDSETEGGSSRTESAKDSADDAVGLDHDAAADRQDRGGLDRLTDGRQGVGGQSPQRQLEVGALLLDLVELGQRVQPPVSGCVEEEADVHPEAHLTLPPCRVVLRLRQCAQRVHRGAQDRQAALREVVRGGPATSEPSGVERHRDQQQCDSHQDRRPPTGGARLGSRSDDRQGEHREQVQVLRRGRRRTTEPPAASGRQHRVGECGHQQPERDGMSIEGLPQPVEPAGAAAKGPDGRPGRLRQPDQRQEREAHGERRPVSQRPERALEGPPDPADGHRGICGPSAARRDGRGVEGHPPRRQDPEQGQDVEGSHPPPTAEERNRPHGDQHRHRRTCREDAEEAAEQPEHVAPGQRTRPLEEEHLEQEEERRRVEGHLEAPHDVEATGGEEDEGRRGGRSDARPHP